MKSRDGILVAIIVTIFVSVFGLATEGVFEIKLAHIFVIVQWSVILIIQSQKNHEEGKMEVEEEYLAIMNDESPIERESIPVAIRNFVITRDAHTCTYCRRQGTREKDPEGLSWHCDHTVPVSRGGKTISSNLTLSCSRCNLQKSSKTPIEYIRYLRDLR